MNFSNKQIKFLKARAHPLKPVMLMGQAGLTQAFLSELDQALTFHELIKIKLVAEDPAQRETMVASILKHSLAYKVQRIGHVLTLYRTSDSRKISLPND